jgi:hypothetical protein
VSPIALTIPDRRLPFLAVLGDSVVCAAAFPLAALLVDPAILANEAAQAVLVLPWALVLLNVLFVLFDPPEPAVCNVPRAITAGIWRATVLFIALLWTLVLTGHGGAVPVGFFVLGWGCLAAQSAVLRTVRLLALPRIPV